MITTSLPMPVATRRQAPRKTHERRRRVAAPDRPLFGDGWLCDPRAIRWLCIGYVIRKVVTRWAERDDGRVGAYEMARRMSKRSRSLTAIASAYVLLHGWGLIGALRSMRLLTHPMPGFDAWFRVFFVSKLLWAALGVAAGIAMLGRHGWTRQWAMWSSLVMLIVFFVSEGPRAVQASWQSPELMRSAITTLAMVALAAISILYFPRPAVARKFLPTSRGTQSLIMGLAAVFLVFWSFQTTQMNRAAEERSRVFNELRSRFPPAAQARPERRVRGGP